MSGASSSTVADPVTSRGTDGQSGARRSRAGIRAVSRIGPAAPTAGRSRSAWNISRPSPSRATIEARVRRAPAAVAPDIRGALDPMEQPLEGGQRSANALGLVPDGRAPGPDGRLDARAIDGRLARGLPERDTPDLRVDLPVGPALRVESRHDDADAPGPQLIRRRRANPRRSGEPARLGAPRSSRFVHRPAPARRRMPSCPAAALRGPAPSGRTAQPARRSHPRRGRSGAGSPPGPSASPATSTRSPRRSPRALAPPSRGARASRASTPRARTSTPTAEAGRARPARGAWRAPRATRRARAPR